jgi:two-component system CheB/CheR fusion protein
VDKSLTRSHEGSGIGLSLVKSIIEMHKGEVYVESELNKGSKFFVELPLRVIEDFNFKSEIEKTSIANVERMNIEFADIYSRE